MAKITERKLPFAQYAFSSPASVCVVSHTATFCVVRFARFAPFIALCAGDTKEFEIKGQKPLPNAAEFKKLLT